MVVRASVAQPCGGTNFAIPAMHKRAMALIVRLHVSFTGNALINSYLGLHSTGSSSNMPAPQIKFGCLWGMSECAVLESINRHCDALPEICERQSRIISFSLVAILVLQYNHNALLLAR